MRFKIFRIIVRFGFIAIVFGLVQTQIVQGDYYHALSMNNRIRVVPIEGRRGRILDRNGVVIADNRASFDVMIIPQEIRDREELFAHLSNTLAIPKEKLLKRFVQKKLAPFAPVVIAEDINKDQAIVLEENKFRFPAVVVQANSKRFYPFAQTNAHLLGYVGKIDSSQMTELKEYGYTMQSIVGKTGIEQYYDRYLKGEGGGLQIEVNNLGRQVRLLGLKEPMSGQDIALTVDQRVQQAAIDSLTGRRGAVVVMDLDTSEIIAMVSSPSFDPNNFVRGENLSDYFKNSNVPLLNRATNGQYPAGSVFKIIDTIAGLETGKINAHTSFSCPGFYQLGRRRFHCLHVHGLQDLMQGLAHSCNVYFYNVGNILGSEIMAQYARMFGLGTATGVDVFSEASGLIPSRKGKGDALNLAIGQGELLVTPIQLTCMISRVANSGKEPQPHFIRSINSMDVELKSLTARPVHLKDKTFEITKAALRDVVKSETGTARVLNIKDLEVSGKTGTAQSSGGRASHAWFVGFCRSEKANIAFCVFLEHGGTSYYACEATKELLLRMKEQNIL
ncbi:MAG: penicillin-binding protein 2 [Candidatus Omnitrophota bacterium]